MRGQFRIAYRNAWRHRMTSLVLLVVFLLTTFVLFWVFSWGTAMADSLKDYIRCCYGDIYYNVNYISEGDLPSSIFELDVKRITTEKNIFAMLDSPKISDVINVRELSSNFLEAAERYIRPVQGRLPERNDEILIPELFHSGILEIGDTLYLSTYTPEQVLNALRYTIVGKHMNQYALVTSESMKLLLNTEQNNFLVIHISSGLCIKERVLETDHQVRTVLADSNIKLNKSKTVYDELERLDYLVKLLPGLKGLIMVVLFPVIGAVIAAIVWIYSIKRRKEIWTYLALGLKDRQIVSLVTLELSIVACFGIALGMALGFISAQIIDKLNVWLSFGYTFSLPLWAKYGFSDIFVIIVFVLISVAVWILPPLLKVIRDKPFSY